MNTKEDIKFLKSILAEENRTEDVILEWKSNAPFDGCYFRYSYALLTWDNTIEPIVTTTQDVELGDTLESTLAVVEAGNWRFDSFATYPINQDLHKEIAPGFWPTFWTFFWQTPTEPFWWECARCGMTNARPQATAGERGNGGIGTEITDWLCEDCSSPIDQYCTICGVPLQEDEDVLVLSRGEATYGDVRLGCVEEVYCMGCGDCLEILPPDGHTIRITVEDGRVCSVEDVPDGMMYEIIDHDEED